MKLRQLAPNQRNRKSKNKVARKELLRQAHGKCWYCGAKVGRKNFRLDHQTAFSKGGADSNRNLVVACEPCDKAKGQKSVDEFREKLGITLFHGER